MDNITHSVVGLGIGALIDRSVAPEPSADRTRVRQRMLLTICCLASNFPDLDLVLTPLLERPLGYLLHHRGHTHTLLGAAVEACLLLGLVWCLWPGARRLLRVSPTARRATLGAAGAGLLLHLGMDSLNVYGVHPFWPVDPDWYYGDLVFIVEPVFWIAFGMPLAAMVKRRPLRRLFLGLMALVPVATAALGFLQWGSLAALAVLGLVLARVQRSSGQQAHRGSGERGRAGLAAGLAVSLVFVGLQAVALGRARALVADALRTVDPGERLLDTALSAYPSNPLCWSFVSVARDGQGGSGSYHLRRGLLSLAPGITPAAHCPARIGGTVPASASPPATPALAWQTEEHGRIAALRALNAADCRVNAWMRFARAPAFAAGVATDLRWGEPGKPNFSTLPYAQRANAPCPRPVPAWGRPRADLLEEG